MLLLTALWTGLAVADLVRWTPERTSSRRRAVALACAALAGALLAVLALGVPGAGGPPVLAVPVAALVLAAAGSTAAWVALSELPASPRAPSAAVTALAALALLHALALAAGPLLPALDASGPLGRWWAALAGAGLPGLDGVGLGRALLAVVGAALLLGTANRVVRLVLVASGTPPTAGEAALRGGRLLGPLERVFLLGLALGGDLTAAAAVIAAKGLLRLPEVRTASRLALAGEPAGGAAGRPVRGADVVTEYFLVGTFSSWLLALAVAGVVALAGP
ncbi:hypothetical protein FHN55_00255 [Streptomyces sp. NP160]|uniref:hypothetical protein n=1 Tax=Streptomyces sp. NP160 TaxID=2586637 RepID=UPI0011189155|nr:hypothetical protein [Streptomyces sp. NP160]TNM70171.1 hypothetical protein FHN55_00255 [Streptomyces sp. NP160]